MAREKIDTTTKTDDRRADEQIAAAITHISDGMRQLLAGPLRIETIVLLVSKASGVSQADVRSVLHSIESLKGQYLKPPKYQR